MMDSEASRNHPDDGDRSYEWELDRVRATVKICGLCGHQMTPERCGSATIGSATGILLCHHDTHSCYRRWTVYGARPDRYPWNVDPGSGSLSEDEERERRGR